MATDRPALHPDESRELVVLLRTRRRWTQRQLAAAAGLHHDTVRRFEAGLRVPRRRTLERLAAAAGVAMADVDNLLLALRLLRLGGGAAAGGEAAAGSDAGLAELEALLHLRLVALAELAAEPLVSERPADPAALWPRLEPFSSAARRVLVRHHPDFHAAPLALWLCEKSELAAADGAERALELADLAAEVADRIPGPSAGRARLGGYAGAFVANAHRVQGDLAAADAQLARAWKRYQEGKSSDPDGSCLEWRLADLEASLRRDQTRFAEALAAHDHACKLAPPTATGRILLSKAGTFEQMGEPARALAALAEAERHIDGGREPRLLCVLEFNRVANLLHLERCAEAARRLPAVRRQAENLGNELDVLRVRWLEAGLFACRRESERAEAAYREVRQAFAGKGIAYDFARVSLDLAVLYLKEKRWREVQSLARETWEIFKAQGVALDALASLKVFTEATERQTATVELARRTARLLGSGGRDAQARG